MHVMIATDAWLPQVNGVVNTYVNLAKVAGKAGLRCSFLTAEGFRTVPLPTYNEIRLALIRPSDVGRRVEETLPDAIHIATEGPIGLATRTYCTSRKRPFTTSYHTRFPEYVAARSPIPVSWGYRFERWFHNAGAGIMAASPSMCAELERQGMRNVHLWSRGVDLELFHPQKRTNTPWPGPVFLYVGRVSVEKNLAAFLDLDLPGTSVVVGEGPQLSELKRRFPDAVFTGAKFGNDLAALYASADAFVFPSRTDTFGNVLLEAQACGLPVAAYPVTGPKDVIVNGKTGILGPSLGDAALAALDIDRAACRSYAETFSWVACAGRFRSIIEIAHGVHAASGID